MADAVTTQVLKDHASAWAVKLTNISDGTGEVNVKKVTANSLIATNGDNSTQRLTITKLFWSVGAGTSSLLSPRVTILWNGASSNTVAVTLTGSGYWDLVTGGQSPLINNANNATGDILLSTVGFTANAAYTVILEGKKTAGFVSRESTDDGISP
jgi:hypothetical protein